MSFLFVLEKLQSPTGDIGEQASWMGELGEMTGEMGSPGPRVSGDLGRKEDKLSLDNRVGVRGANLPIPIRVRVDWPSMCMLFLSLASSSAIPNPCAPMTILSLFDSPELLRRRLESKEGGEDVKGSLERISGLEKSRRVASIERLKFFLNGEMISCMSETMWSGDVVDEGVKSEWMEVGGLDEIVCGEKTDEWEFRERKGVVGSTPTQLVKSDELLRRDWLCLLWLGVDWLENDRARLRSLLSFSGMGSASPGDLAASEFGESIWFLSFLALFLIGEVKESFLEGGDNIAATANLCKPGLGMGLLFARRWWFLGVRGDDMPFSEGP